MISAKLEQLRGALIMLDVVEQSLRDMADQDERRRRLDVLRTAVQTSMVLAEQEVIREIMRRPPAA